MTTAADALLNRLCTSAPRFISPPVPSRAQSNGAVAQTGRQQITLRAVGLVETTVPNFGAVVTVYRDADDQPSLMTAIGCQTAIESRPPPAKEQRYLHVSHAVK
jgi:hypothetical protein